MQPDQQALLQERVRTLILRHALEAVLDRFSTLAGESSEDELLYLERTILSAAQIMPDKVPKEKLAVLTAVEDASDTIRAAFGKFHDHHAVRSPAKLALVA